MCRNQDLLAHVVEAQVVEAQCIGAVVAGGAARSFVERDCEWFAQVAAVAEVVVAEPVPERPRSPVIGQKDSREAPEQRL
jgi:hypothetical protein